MTVDWILLGVQAAASIAMLVVLRTLLLPSLAQMDERTSVREVWLPLLLIGPLLFAAGRSGHTVGAAAWLAIGLPVLIGFAAIGLALLFSAAGSSAYAVTDDAERRCTSDDAERRCTSDDAERRCTLRPLAMLIWTIVGIVFLMLCAVNELSIWTGQCAFAAGAVVMWLNTPDVPSMASNATQRSARHRVLLAVPVLLLCAVAQGFAILVVSESRLMLSAAVYCCHAFIALALIARGDKTLVLRVGGWAAAYGVLFGIGLTSFLRMLPVVWQSVRTLVADAEPVHVELQQRAVFYVAHGYGWLAAEAVLMLLLAGAGVGVLRLSPRVGRIVGMLMLAGAAMLVLWRMATLFDAG